MELFPVPLKLSFMFSSVIGQFLKAPHQTVLILLGPALDNLYSLKDHTLPPTLSEGLIEIFLHLGTFINLVKRRDGPNSV
jgi:hypothetical protein